MIKQIFLYLKSAEQYYWWQQGENEIFSSRAEELAFKAKSANLIVILPMEDFVCLPTDVKTNNEYQQLKVAPYALEDELLSPVEDNHFALEPKTKGQTRRFIWVVKKDKIEQWLKIVKSLNLSPEALVPESALINSDSSIFTIWVEPNRIIVSHENLAIKTNHDNIATIIDKLPKEINTSSCDVINFDPNFNLTFDQLDCYLQDKTSESFLATMEQNYNAKTTINLLQGSFAQKSKLIKIVKKWQLPIVLATACLLFYSVLLSIENSKLTEQNQALDKMIQSALALSFPKEKLTNPGVQMRQRLTAYQLLKNKYHAFTLLLNKLNPIFDANKMTASKLMINNGTLKIQFKNYDKKLLKSIEAKIRQLNYRVTLKFINNTVAEFVIQRELISSGSSPRTHKLTQSSCAGLKTSPHVCNIALNQMPNTNLFVTRT